MTEDDDIIFAAAPNKSKEATTNKCMAKDVLLHLRSHAQGSP